MKILHIAPNAPYNDYWGYQDNLLPKYHKKMGHEVTVIITNQTHQDGKIVEVPCLEYDLNDGVRIIRKAYSKKFPYCFMKRRFAYFDVYRLICEINPDFIFFHGLLSATIFDVVKYKKLVNQDCIIVQDNHLDYNIGVIVKSVKQRVVRLFYRSMVAKTQQYVAKVYGVTPWRKTYAEDYFGIPSEKTDVLIMGADDEKIDFANRERIRAEIREKYGISDGDFLVVTGGKIDKKKKIDILMQAVASVEGAKLLVFGNVLDDAKEEFDRILAENDNIIYIGWIDADRVYDYFFAADLVFFPGQHSVLWEQACASKAPCVFERWEGMDHVDNGGNSDFVSPVTYETLKTKIEELLFTDKYYAMKAVAESEKTDIYLYSKIAEKSLECAKEKC